MWIRKEEEAPMQMESREGRQDWGNRRSFLQREFSSVELP